MICWLWDWVTIYIEVFYDLHIFSCFTHTIRHNHEFFDFLKIWVMTVEGHTMWMWQSEVQSSKKYSQNHLRDPLTFCPLSLFLTWIDNRYTIEITNTIIGWILLYTTHTTTLHYLFLLFLLLLTTHGSKSSFLFWLLCSSGQFWHYRILLFLLGRRSRSGDCEYENLEKQENDKREKKSHTSL